MNELRPQDGQPETTEFDRDGRPLLSAAMLRSFLESRGEDLTPVLAAYGEQIMQWLENNEQQRLSLKGSPFSYLAPHIGASADEYLTTVLNVNMDCKAGKSSISDDPIPVELCGLTDDQFVTMTKEALSVWTRRTVGDEFAQQIETMINIG